MRFVSALCFALLLSSCGSRSALLDGTSAAGTGGTAGTAGTGAVAGFGGSTGGGGVGAFGGGGIGAAGGGGVGAFGGGGTGAIGGSTQCFGLYPFEPTADVQHDGGWSDGPPQLAFSSDDAQQLSVAFVTAKTSGTTRQTRHVSFAPWQVWPPPLPIAPAYSTFISPELSPDFALGSSTNGHIALAVAHVPVGGKPFVTFAPEVSATGGAAGGNVTLPSAGSPVFVSRGPAGHHLVGVSDGNMLQASIVQSFGSGFNVTPLLLACGQNAKIADAAPFESGWVVALANEKTAPPPPSCSAAANGPMRLDVVFVSPDGAVSSVLAIEEQMAIGRIAVAPHSTGAYVVWHVTSGGKVAPLRFMRVDVEDASAWGPVDVSGPSDLPLDDFDVAALGPTAAAIAWGNDPAGNPPDLMVTVMSDSGNLMSSHAFEPSFFGPLAILGDPAGQSLVVGWREQTATGGEAGVRLRRLGCFGED